MNNLSCLLVIFLAVTASAFPDGAPDSVCLTMLPDHGGSPITTPAPTRVFPSKTRVRPGETITITIEGIHPAFQFRGFMLQTRNVVSPNNPLGTVVPGTEYKTVNCGGGPTTATHTNNELRSSVVVTWTAPQFTGGVRAQ